MQIGWDDLSLDRADEFLFDRRPIALREYVDRRRRLEEFAVARVADDVCPHEDGPLSEGFVEGDEVECPWHAARFNIKTGKKLCEPAYEDVASYPVRVTGDDIEVEV